MRRIAFAPALRVVVVLVAAGVGYLLFIPVTHVQRGRLAQLAVPHTGLAIFQAKPASAQALPASSSTFNALKQAAKRSPNSTGSYSVEWKGAKSSTTVSALTVSLLPGAADAQTMESEATSQYLAKQAFKAESYIFDSTSSLAAVPGAQQSTFHVKATKTTPANTLSVAVFRIDRAVAVVWLQTPSADPQVLAALATAEHTQLQRVLPGFSLSVTTYPLEASLIYAGVAVALAGSTVAGPALVGRVRRARQRRAAEAVKVYHLARGNKVLKRQRTRR